MIADSTPTLAHPELQVVTEFLARELKSAHPLTAQEVVKVEDLHIDVTRHVDRMAPEDAGNPTPLGKWIQSLTAWWRDNTVLGTIFNGFERLASLPVPYWVGHPVLWAAEILLGRNRVKSDSIECHTLVATLSEPDAFAKDFRLFDRLSIIHGGEFRGSIVANYVLGIVASGTVLFSLTVGRMLHPGQVDHSWSSSTWIEIVCLVIIACVYFRGSTPESSYLEPTTSPRLGRQRWHQRWLEYRVLAERFRYVDMLLPLGKGAAQSISIAPESAANRMWHHRYFVWRVSDATVVPQNAIAYRNRVLALMIEQEQYHARNFVKRGAIAHRLHRLAGICFALGLLICVVDNWVPEKGRDVSLFFAAMFPVVAAAIHGILANTEYTKVAENSGDVAQEIHAQVVRLRAVPVPPPDVAADEYGLADVRDIVLEFAGTVINEATGWRSMLRDKNVPLV